MSVPPEFPSHIKLSALVALCCLCGACIVLVVVSMVRAFGDGT